MRWVADLVRSTEFVLRRHFSIRLLELFVFFQSFVLRSLSQLNLAKRGFFLSTHSLGYLKVAKYWVG